MAKVRVKDLAKQMGISSKDLIFKLQSLGVQVENEDAAIEPGVIMAILSGKKAAPRRPRAVIMRDEKPGEEQQAQKPKLVRPPRPIVKPTRREKKPVEEGVVAEPTSQGPVIQEFLEAAEQEAAEQARAAEEAKKREAEEREAAAKTAAERQAEAAKKPAAAAEAKKPAAGRPAAAGKAEEKRRGPTGPRARTALEPRPDYGDQRRPPQRQRIARPAGPAGAGGPAMAPPEPSAPPAPAARRRRTEEEDRPEKKKHTGRRRRATAIERERQELLTKGPFSASAVLDEEDTPVRKKTEAGVEEEEFTPTPSARRDKRKQAAPVSAKVLEFKRPEAPITLTEGTTVRDLAEKLDVKANDLIKHLLMKKGRMLSINTPLEPELALEIATDLGIEAEIVSFEQSVEREGMDEATGGTEPRAPVITVMGHVDHGKTSLLDAIRETRVAEGEAGGITQHIGAYEVEKNGQKIVFLDTPGHEAFTLMRARGAKATDIVVLVVAADDGVMPQTREAIDHAQAAGVPMIVAINKIDRPNANAEKVRQELSQVGVLVEQWGGDTVSVEVSAIKKQGIDDLLEMILLQAEVLELKAASDRPARGVVLEAKKELGRGNVATVLVQDGTLRVGETFISGTVTGKVRAMLNDRGERVTSVGPATPVSVMGFDELPDAGDSFVAVDEVEEARTIAELRQQKAKKEASDRRGPKMSLDQLFVRMQQGQLKELNLIVKADVQGSVEVLRDTLHKLSNPKVEVKVLHASVGAISTNDVLLASASDAIIIGFAVRPEKNASELARKEEVDIRLHTIIYELHDEMKLAMTGLLEPITEEVFKGRAEVRDLFKVPRAGTVAGSYVTEGIIPRSASIRLLRDNRVIHEGKIGSLRHFKDDVSEVRQGFECGIGIERFNDVKVGDVIEAFILEQRAASLE
jgi:translation initiation factor IF-2